MADSIGVVVVFVVPPLVVVVVEELDFVFWLLVVFNVTLLPLRVVLVTD